MFNNHDGEDDPTPSVVTIKGMKAVFSGLIVTNTEASQALNVTGKPNGIRQRRSAGWLPDL